MKSNDQTNNPTHIVYSVTGEGDNAYWDKIGAAWEHQDREGMTQVLRILGHETKLVVRKAKNNNTESV